MTEPGRRYPLPLSTSALAALVPCSRDGGCPLGVDAPAIAKAILEGDHARAYRIARGPNPFASCCGHGCHAPCETACRRRYFGAPVAIGALEAYAAQHAAPPGPGANTSPHECRSVAQAESAATGTRQRSSTSAKRIAIVGGGAAGMACAHDLSLLGHSCVVFDAADEPGGLLTAALPEFRFPVASARGECAAILALGIEYRGGTCLSDAAVLRSLAASEFDGVFLAIGASAPRAKPLGLEAHIPGVHDAMEFLTGDLTLARRVVIAGEGDLAVDAARVAARRTSQADSECRPLVTLVLAHSLEASGISHAMLSALVRDGIALHHGWHVEHIQPARDGGEVVSVTVSREQDGIRKVFPCDHLILAGPRSPHTAPFADALALDGDGFILVDAETLQTSMPNVWAGGACTLGHRSIAHAVADGKRAAWQIHAALTGMQVGTTRHFAWVEADDHDAERTGRALAATRRQLPLFDLPTPGNPGASVVPDALDLIRHEAARCLDCTTLPFVDNEACTNCGKCVAVCPVGAFSIAKEPLRRLLFDQEICTRCGHCAERCPEDAISMLRAVWDERLSFERKVASVEGDELAAFFVDETAA